MNNRRADAPTAVLLASVAFYNQRGGGVETSFKEDTQGLVLTQRAKKRFAAYMRRTGASCRACTIPVRTVDATNASTASAMTRATMAIVSRARLATTAATQAAPSK